MENLCPLCGGSDAAGSRFSLIHNHHWPVAVVAAMTDEQALINGCIAALEHYSVSELKTYMSRLIRLGRFFPY